ncbi:unnamed protein product [Soboliphyme baturini]|uniref:Large ribosomal subunit protein uL29m n=1 Tax=Soboliphyme baturini TaxID=241478 RepID=A0A183ICZ2_9BILA|nr:unnamed protein product [Soboliphyme baturini]
MLRRSITLIFNRFALQYDSTSRSLSITHQYCDVMEFFDSKKNWGKNDVKTGRPWRKEELRLKSNVDLHKLWYVLLKERNMLYTMEQAAKDSVELFPSPERIYKVEESMKNLEDVVHERNKAYLELTTGESGERPSKYVTTFLGFRVRKELDEHIEPPHMNPKGKEYEQPFLDDDAYIFQKYWKEKEWLQKRDKDDDERRNSGKHKYIYRY